MNLLREPDCAVYGRESAVGAVCAVARRPCRAGERVECDVSRGALSVCALDRMIYFASALQF